MIKCWLFNQLTSLLTERLSLLSVTSCAPSSIDLEGGKPYIRGSSATLTGSDAYPKCPSSFKACSTYFYFPNSGLILIRPSQRGGRAWAPSNSGTTRQGTARDWTSCSRESLFPLGRERRYVHLDNQHCIECTVIHISLHHKLTRS